MHSIAGVATPAGRRRAWLVLTQLPLQTGRLRFSGGVDPAGDTLAGWALGRWSRTASATKDIVVERFRGGKPRERRGRPGGAPMASYVAGYRIGNAARGGGAVPGQECERLKLSPTRRMGPRVT